MIYLLTFSSTGLAIIIILVVFSAIATGYLFSRRYFTNLEHIRETAFLKAEADNRVLRAQVETQEQTFQNISRDIHDDIGQKLSLVKFYIERSEATDLGDAPQIISGVLAHLRDLSKNLSADLVKKEGVYEAIKADLERVNRQGSLSATLVRSDQMYFLTENTEIILFRIYQEAVQNILKHAQATTLVISLSYQQEVFRMSVIDDGTGFSNPDSRGQGLQNIANRIKSINGTHAIESSKDGTRLSITLPIIRNGKNQNIPS